MKRGACFFSIPIPLLRTLLLLRRAAQHSQLKPFSPLAQLLQTPFEYPTQSENDYESLEHSRAFPGHPPFGNEGSAGAVFRSDGYDPLNPPPFQQVNLRPANAFDYRHHSTNVARHDVP